MRGGHLSTHGEIPKIDDAKVRLVKGWFQDSLPGVIDAIADESREKAVLVHFDADLYSSTLYLLVTIAHEIREFYFIFDEYMGHELRALYNFMQASGANVEFISYIVWEDQPAVVFGKISLSPK